MIVDWLTSIDGTTFELVEGSLERKRDTKIPGAGAKN
jgi:hypothetical protein